MNTTNLSAARERRKEERARESRTSSQEGDRARLKRTPEQVRIIVTVKGVVTVLMEGTNESKLFADYVEKDAYSIELVTAEEASDVRVSA